MSVRDGRLLDPLGKVSGRLQESKRAYFVMINRLWLRSCQVNPKDSVSSQKSLANENKSFELKAGDQMSGNLAGEEGGLPQKDPTGLQISSADLWVLDWAALSCLFSCNSKWLNGHKKTFTSATTLPYIPLFLRLPLWTYMILVQKPVKQTSSKGL